MNIDHIADLRWEKKDPVTGEQYKFITNIMDPAPGVVARLYRMRRDIEKVFDSFKNKLNETKAWATSSEAKSIR